MTQDEFLEVFRLFRRELSNVAKTGFIYKPMYKSARSTPDPFGAKITAKYFLRQLDGLIDEAKKIEKAKEPKKPKPKKLKSRFRAPKEYCLKNIPARYRSALIDAGITSPTQIHTAFACAGTASKIPGIGSTARTRIAGELERICYAAGIARDRAREGRFFNDPEAKKQEIAYWKMKPEDKRPPGF